MNELNKWYDNLNPLSRLCIALTILVPLGLLTKVSDIQDSVILGYYLIILCWYPGWLRPIG